jgi:hypothetical protein
MSSATVLERAAPGSLTDEVLIYMAKVPYRQAVGCVMHLMLHTRPDIAYAIGVLARFMSYPAPHHWKAMQRLLQYIHTTREYVFMIGGHMHADAFFPWSCCDADYGGETDRRRSTSGLMVGLGSPLSCHRDNLAYALIVWCSCLQAIIAQSTCEAELVALVMAAKELIALRYLLTETNVPILVPSRPSLMLGDNQASLAVASEPASSSRVKHMEIRANYLSDRTERHIIKLQYIETDDNVSDIFTKPLDYVKYVQFRKDICVVLPSVE